MKVEDLLFLIIALSVLHGCAGARECTPQTGESTPQTGEPTPSQEGFEGFGAIVPDRISPACGTERSLKKLKGIRGGWVTDEHRVSSVLMDKMEVTVFEYLECVAADACKPAGHGDITYGSDCNSDYPDRQSHPINCVSQSDASAYCAWRGGRLPTAWEWVWAAQGRDEKYEFPWGKGGPTCDNSIVPLHSKPTPNNRSSVEVSDHSDGWEWPGYGCGMDSTWPVGSRPRGATRDGVLDMIGNVAEWTATFDEYGSVLVLGGGWTGAVSGIWEDWRLDPEEKYSTVGFRCVRDYFCR
jgi:formylglycine-generating enzyme